MRKIGYSFGFLLTNLLRLRHFLATKTPLSFFNLLFIFFVIFLFIIKNLVSSGIKVVSVCKKFFKTLLSDRHGMLTKSRLLQTHKVIVDSSQLVDQREKIFHANMNACFFEESHLDVHRMFMNEPLVKHIYEKKWALTDKCYVMKTRNVNVLKNKLFFLPSVFFFVLRFLASVVKNDLFSSRREPLGTSNLAYYLSKGIDAKLRSAIDQLWVIPLFEQGHLKKMFELCEVQLVDEFPLNNAIFTSLNEYVTAYTFTSNVRFSQFKVFVYLHVLLLWLFTAIQAGFLAVRFALKMYFLRRNSL